MTPTPEQREKYARISYEAMQAWWNQQPGAMHEDRIPWEEAHEVLRMDIYPSAEAVALAAQRDLIGQMVTDATTGSRQVVLTIRVLTVEGVEIIPIADYLNAYLPAGPSPQEDQE